MRIPRYYEARQQSGAAKPFSALRCAFLQSAVPVRSRGFTLIELILVMTLLVIGVSFISPHLGGFFRGRAMQSEARRLISLSRVGQSRAVSGGVPVILYFDSQKNTYGITEEPGYYEGDKDPKGEELEINQNLKMEIPGDDPSMSQTETVDSSDPHMNLPHITFLPDGTIADGSPKTINIIDNNGPKLSVTQTRDRSQYEIGTTEQQ